MTDRWTLTMVGAVSPDPMMVRSRGRSPSATGPLGLGLGEERRRGVHDLVLEHAQVLVDGELVDAGVGSGRPR